MASLTKTAIATRKGIRFSFYGVILLIVLRIVIGIGINVYKRFFPPPPPAPTVAFGKLPKLLFPKIESESNLSYTLETPEGGLPVLLEQARVFFMPQPSAGLLALDSAKSKASALGYSPNPEQVSQSVYKFKHERSVAILQINIVTGVFSISYNLKEDPSPINIRPPAPEIANANARSFLSSGSLLPTDLTGRVENKFLKISEGNLIDALSLSESNLIEVNLFRSDYDELPSVTADPDRANVWLLISGNSERGRDVVGGEYHYFPLEEDRGSTYPLKSSQVAWEELLGGGGYIAQTALTEADVVIRRVYLAYYDAGVASQFYQPVVVFEGDNGFIAYIPAISHEYYGE